MATALTLYHEMQACYGYIYIYIYIVCGLKVVSADGVSTRLHELYILEVYVYHIVYNIPGIYYTRYIYIYL